MSRADLIYINSALALMHESDDSDVRNLMFKQMYNHINFLIECDRLDEKYKRDTAGAASLGFEEASMYANTL